ncbi:MAG: hypothetical protein RBU23_06115 [Candidatus Auribacterota bacterium]|nr:hypothetical protein [Candidatus Auribacterota bacterium]
MINLVFAEKIVLKDGQVFDGTIIEEQNSFLRIQSGFEIMQIERDQILSIQRTSSRPDKTGSNESLPEESMDDATKMSSLQYYKETVKILNDQINVHKATITFMDGQLQELQKKALSTEAELKNKIKKLEQELENSKNSPVESLFTELAVIQPNKEITIDKGYIKKIKFRISEGIDGYFIGAEYTLLSEFVRIEPNFVTYFFDERGLNIGTDLNNMRFNIIPRGQEQVITKGISMTIPDLRPYYYYIKINTDNEDQNYR